MTRTPSQLADLLADCDAHGIRLALADGGRLEIDAPQNALTPDLSARLKAHKAALLVMLRPAPDLPLVNQDDAAAVWQAAPDRLEAERLFPPDVMESLRAAEVRWGYEPAPAVATSDAPAKPAKPVCRCGSTSWRDVPIHDGQSMRRDCGLCGRFLDFPIWHGTDAVPNAQ